MPVYIIDLDDGHYLGTIWGPLEDHLRTTWRPLGDHLVTTWPTSCSMNDAESAQFTPSSLGYLSQYLTKTTSFKVVVRHTNPCPQFSD